MSAMELKGNVKQFLYHEASLLDQALWTEWLGLCTEDMSYWIPCKTDVTDPELEVHIIYDNYERMSDRINRLLGGNAYAQSPPSKTCHLISNVVVDTRLRDTVHVTSNFIVTELRRAITTVYSGQCIHELAVTDEGYRIRSKTVKLINSSEYLGNLSIIL